MTGPGRRRVADLRRDVDIARRTAAARRAALAAAAPGVPELRSLIALIAQTALPGHQGRWQA